MEKDKIIRFFHVHKRYHARQALVDLSFDIERNEFLFVSGPSGAGKSTLLRLLYLGERASEGQIIIDGINLSRIPEKRIPFLRRKFGIIFQDYKLIPGKTVYENVALVPETRGTPAKTIRKRVREVLKTVSMLDRQNAYPKSLSGGEQQRVAVARAIIGDPEIILADEPTGSLDARAAEIIMRLLTLLHENGATVLVATHDTALIRRTGGRVIILENGRLEVSTILPPLAE